ncbi:MAG: exo-alpha-sialidase [Bryobacterales bacterium]|nr:exo-alpha-sialidase [Bryobacterales bacterium]
MADRVEHLDVLAREPMVIERPDRAVFAAGYGSGHPALWKSVDHGATWNRVNVGTAEEGDVGNSDVDLAVAPDGALYFVNMTFDIEKKEGTQITVGVSRDSGAHWTWRTLSKNRCDDRPWVRVASDGTAHVIWNDGSGVRHSISRDMGATWTEPARIAPKGGSSHLAVGPNRQIAVRVVPASASGLKFDPGIDQIVVSADGGKTWKTHAAPGERKWSANLADFPPRWVEPIAWDADSKLYSFWTNDHELWLARSADRGETWKTWKLGESKESAYFPYLVAHGKREVACTWFSGRGATLQAHAGLIMLGSDDRPPRLVESAPFQIDAWRRNGTDRDTGGEHLGITFLRRGGFAVVSPIQDIKDHRVGFTWMTFIYSKTP